MTLFAGATIETADTPALTDRGDGALGCFVVDSQNRPALLTCAHVLFPGFQAPGDVDVYSPGYTSCCGDDPIATWKRADASASDFDVDGYKRGFAKTKGPVQIPATAGEGFTTDPNGDCSTTDCATAPLRPGIQFHNALQTPEGTIPIVGLQTDFEVIKSRGKASAGQAPTAEQYVRVYSPRSNRVIWGTFLWKEVSLGTPGEVQLFTEAPLKPSAHYPFGISDVGPAEDRAAGAIPNIYQYLILPRPKPSGGAYEDDYAVPNALDGFVRGDSGSVVIDHEGKVIAMIVRKAEFKLQYAKEEERDAIEFRKAVGLGIGVASPIQYVMDRLDVSMPESQAGWSDTAPGRGAPARFFVPTIASDGELDSHRRGIEELRARMMTSRRGRLVLGLIARHRREIRFLFRRVRAITAAWRTLRGPAYVHHGLRSVRDPSHVIPTAIDGVTRERLRDVLLPLLAAHGSPALRRDVGRYGAWAAGAFLDLPSVREAPAAAARRQEMR